MPFEETKPTKVEWWPLPREGEIVPDYPPQDITHCIASGSFSDGLDEVVAEVGAPPLSSWQREVAQAALGSRRVRFGLSFDVAAYLRAIAAAEAIVDGLAHLLDEKKRLRKLRRWQYRRRQLARRRRNR